MSEPEPDATPVVGATSTDSIKPLDVDGVGAVAAGTLAWAVALIVCLLLHTSLTEAGRGWWIWVCVSGLLLGLAGLWFVRRRRAHYAATRTV